MSEKRMAVSLTVLELQRQKWTGGILPPAAGIRVKTVAVTVDDGDYVSHAINSFWTSWHHLQTDSCR